MRALIALFMGLLLMASSPAAADHAAGNQSSGVLATASLETPLLDRSPAGRLMSLPAGETVANTCCKVCRKGKPCGNSCISRSATCRQPPGCACRADGMMPDRADRPD